MHEVEVLTPLMRIEVRSVSACLLVGLTLLFGGCRSSTDRSAFYEEFDLTKLATDELKVTTTNAHGSGTYNEATGIAVKEWFGTFAGKDASTIGTALFKELQKRIEKESGGRINSTGSLGDAQQPSGNAPANGVIMYNVGKRHGELRLWTFPTGDDKMLHFVALLREEPLK